MGETQADDPAMAMDARTPLDGQRFEIIVIGGGISGVAIARECARAGRRTLLLEQHDFAAGTTSRSTRIIHGGLRYLEHGDIVQVRESLRERQRLLREYPHLVSPLEFVLALEQDSPRSALAVRAGLWLYRRMGGAHGRRNSVGEQQARLERLLDGGRRFSLFSFEDGQCEFPERLVAEWLAEATDAGCVARNHTQVLTVEISSGRATGVRLRDRLSGTEQRIESRWIVNASGPWADQLCQVSSIHTPNPMVGGVRGSHIVLPPFAGAPHAALYTEAVDGRPIFVVPWNEQILVGSTEVPDESDPGRVVPSADEIEYLLGSVNWLFPHIHVSQADVGSTFAGVRPLPYSPGASPAAITRRHSFRDHADDGAAGMISVIGGKLTTAASLARDCARKIGAVPGKSSIEAPRIAVASADSVDRLLDAWVDEVAKAGQISHDSARVLVEWHGRRSLAIAELARRRPQLCLPLCPDTGHIVAEAVEAVEREQAVTLADILLRRVPVALGACWSSDCAREAATRIGAAVGWDERRRGTELAAFEAERHAFLRTLR